MYQTNFNKRMNRFLVFIYLLLAFVKHSKPNTKETVCIFLAGTQRHFHTNTSQQQHFKIRSGQVDCTLCSFLTKSAAYSRMSIQLGAQIKARGPNFIGKHNRLRNCTGCTQSTSLALPNYFLESRRPYGDEILLYLRQEASAFKLVWKSIMKICKSQKVKQYDE